MITADRQIAWPKANPCPTCGRQNKGCKIAPDGGAVLCWHSSAGEWQGKVRQLDQRRRNGNGQHHRPDPAPTKPIETFGDCDLAISAMARFTRIPDHWTLEKFEYKRAGKLYAVVARWDDPDSADKTVRPAHATLNGWAKGDPQKWFPYRIDEVAHAQTVYVVEGELCADHAHKLGLPTVTSSHGCKAAAGTDWSDLAGKDWIILPDADEAGDSYAKSVQVIGKALGCRTKIVALPGLENGEDIIDFDRAIGGEPADTLAAVEAAAEAVDWTPPETTGEFPAPMSIGELCRQHRELRRPQIHGLARTTEVIGIIGASKSRKSYTLMDLAVATATGGLWLGNYRTEPGRVLLVDCELHAETFSHRLAEILHARALTIDTVAADIDVLPIRAYVKDVYILDSYFKEHVRPGQYRLIVIDPVYRLLPPGVDENSNSDMTPVYGLFDAWGERLQATIAISHHSSKGDQSQKAVTDTGSGASTQARIVDCHCVMRPHEEEDCAVFEAVSRSFPPPPALCLRWRYPLWTPAPELDPTALRVGGRPKRPRPEPTPEVEEPAWTAERFAHTFVTAEPRTQSTLVTMAEGAKLSERKAARLLAAAVEAGLVHEWVYQNRRLPHKFSTLPQVVTATGDGGVL